MEYRAICKTKTVKFLKGSTGENLCNLGLGKSFFRYDTKSTILKKK